MTFSFGSTAQPAAGGFGASTAAAPAFGAPTSAPAFGASTAAAPAFGGFGAAATSTAAPAFGASTAAAPAFGATQNTGFGGFGKPATTASTGFGGFGATATQNTGFGAPATQTSGFGGFGAAASSAAPAFGSFGAASTAQNTSFGAFGAKTTQTGFGGFGTTTTTNSFGGLGTSFGNVGGANTGFSSFGAPQQQQQQQQLQQQQAGGVGDVDAALYQSVMQCNLFNDTRDTIIARLNMLQASWGHGKAFYSNQAQPVNISPDNPLSRFKAIGYSVIPKHENSDGLVCLVMGKKASEVETGKSQFNTSLTQVLGNKPGLSVSIESIKETGDNTCDVIVTVTENVNGATRKIPSQDLSTFFTGQAMQLKNFGVTNVYAKVGLSKTELEDYLSKPPKGVDGRLWKQAVADNPNPSKFIPVPLIGFKSIQSRISAQEAQNKAHSGRLDVLAEEIQTLKKKQADACASLTEAKRRQVELAHRVLRVLVKQESTRKVGFTLGREEEQLMTQLEGVAAELATPTQFRGRLHELLSCVRLQNQGGAGLAAGERYTLDQGAVSDIKEVLAEQQRGIQAMMQCVKDDFNDLETIIKKIKNV